MKNMIKYKGLLSLVPVVALWLFSCTNDKEFYVSQGETDRVVFSVRMPLSRTIDTDEGDAYDRMIGSLDVLVFDAASDTTFLYHAKGEPAGRNRFEVHLERKPDVERFTFYLLVNAEDQVSALRPEAGGWEALEGERTGVIRQALTAETGIREAWNAAKGIPMWGCLETTAGALRPGAEYGVSVLRMLAKVNLGVVSEIEENFEIREVYLYNYHTRGYLIPEPGYVRSVDNDGDEYKYVSAPTLNKTWLPTGIGDPVIVYKSDDALPDNERNDFYLFEAPQGTKGAYAENICLVVGARLEPEGEIRYFRLDFVDKDKGYVAVKRNHLYQIRIKYVSGDGKETPEEAYRSTSANLDAGIVEYEDFALNTVLEDTRYVFLVSDSELVFHANASNREQDAHLTITTNHPDGWRIDKVSFDHAGLEPVVTYEEDIPTWHIENSVDYPFWFTVNSNCTSSRTGIAPVEDEKGFKSYKVIFAFGVNRTGEDRTVYVHFSYGRHTYVLPLTQKAIQGVGYTTVQKYGYGWMQMAREDYEYMGNPVISEVNMTRLIASPPVDFGDYIIPSRSEIVMMWVYDEAFEDEMTGLPFSHLMDTNEEGYTISARTTYWTDSHRSNEAEPGHALSWINMARGKIICYNLTPNPPQIPTYNSDEYLGGIGGRRLRLVRPEPNGEENDKYPYTMPSAEGPVIVSRYAGRGVAQRAILGGLWIEEHTEQDMTNAVAAILQIENDDQFQDGDYSPEYATELCKRKNGEGHRETGVYDWRLPTQRELQLIYALGGAPPDQYIAEDGLASFPMLYASPGSTRLRDLHVFDGYTPLNAVDGILSDGLIWYWTATKSSRISPVEPTRHWAVSNSGQTRAVLTTDPAKVRCVRTLRSLPKSADDADGYR